MKKMDRVPAPRSLYTGGQKQILNMRNLIIEDTSECCEDVKQGIWQEGWNRHCLPRLLRRISLKRWHFSSTWIMIKWQPSEDPAKRIPGSRNSNCRGSENGTSLMGLWTENQQQEPKEEKIGGKKRGGKAGVRLGQLQRL